MYRNSTSCLVSVHQSSGVELNVHLVLDEKPSRQEQKLKSLNQYVQDYPSGWKKRLELANLLYARGAWQQAIEEYRQFLERQPQLIEVSLKLGKILQIIGRKTEAIEIYENALNLSKNNAIQRHLRSVIALCKGDTDKAIIEIDLAVSLEPDNRSHWLALGQLQMGRENAIEALQAFEQVLSLNPDDIVVLRNSYDALMAVGDIQGARQRLNRMIDLAPDDFGVLQRQLDVRVMGLVSGEQGKQTKKMISSALRLAPHSAVVYKSLAYYHILRGDWKQGVHILAEFTDQHPNNPSGWYYYGRALFQTGDYQTAAMVMLKAYYLYPDDCEIYRGLCEILPMADMTSLCADVEVQRLPLGYEEKRVKTATNSINLALIVEEMLKRFPERWSVWATAGRVLVESLQKIDRGCRFAFKGTQLQPLLPDAWFRYGRVLALAGKHGEAVEALEKGWEFLPEKSGYLQCVPAAVWLAESYRVLGDEGASWKWWKVACLLSGELRFFYGATADYWRGRALEGLGDVVGAMEAYRSAVSQQLFYPALGEVKVALKRLKALTKKGSGV